jgi:hypothetical protein
MQLPPHSVRLQVSARRHPTLPNALLVSVEDDSGPVSDLAPSGSPASGARSAFRVVAWTMTEPPTARCLPGAPLECPIWDVVAPISPANGLYELRLDRPVMALDDEPKPTPPETLDGVVYAVIVARRGTFGLGVAISPPDRDPAHDSSTRVQPRAVTSADGVPSARQRL